MKALLGTFNQEKALGLSMIVKTADGWFAALISTHPHIIVRSPHVEAINIHPGGAPVHLAGVEVGQTAETWDN